MTKNKLQQRLKYLSSDIISAIIAWTLFFFLRRHYVDRFDLIYPLYKNIDDNFIYGVFFIPLFWVVLYSLQGYYKHIFRKSRLYEFIQTISITVIGTLIVFFVLMLDDLVKSYDKYYTSLFLLFILHFSFTYIPRYFITHLTNLKIQKRKIGFNTLIIGCNEKAYELYNRLNTSKHSSGYFFKGFVNVFEREHYLLTQHLPHLGTIENVHQIIKEQQIEEVIIALESKEHKEIEQVLNYLEGFSIYIKAIPDNTDIISGKVKISSIFDEPLIQISHDLMPTWQESLKRIIDISVSIIVLLGFSPVFIIIAILVKFSSKGPIIYSHQRIGKNGKPFTIFKYRTMIVNSETNGPKLTQLNDNRITKIGVFLRKARLDEIPQFYNVLIGDMSLVGPRPEREYFINQITKIAPHYVHLHKVRPGITSLGQVKYGYAKNIDEMIERLRYDIIYIENMSLFIDIKILMYTIKTVILGRGL